MNASAAKIQPEIDAEIRQLKADAIELHPDPAPAEPTPESKPEGTDVGGAVPEIVESWRPAAEYCYKVFKAMGTNWEFSDESGMMIVDGLTDLLDLYFPGGPTMWRRWGPWAKLLGGIGVLGFLNFDPATKKLRDFSKKKVKPNDEKTGRDADSGGGANANGQDAEHAKPGESR